MNSELLLLSREDTDTLIEQTKTKPQETLKFEMNKKWKLFRSTLQKTLLKKENGY